MDKQMQLIGEIVARNKMVCRECGGNVLVKSFSFKTSERADFPFVVKYECPVCNTEYEVEGKTVDGEFIPSEGTVRKYKERVNY